MIRTITVISAFLLTTGSTIHAEDRGQALPTLGFNPDLYQPLYTVDLNMSPQEYEERYRHNLGIVQKNLRLYSRNLLEQTGMPERGISLLGAAAELAVNGPRLDMEINRRLSLELKDVDIAEHALYLELNLDW
jgi:hypothetical protein